MRHLISKITAVAGAASLALASLAVLPAAAHTGTDKHHGGPARPEPDATPYLGWSSWSMQTLTPFPEQGEYSWLTEENLVAQVDYMAEHLLEYGYEYINIDAGWWREWDWTPVYDEYGRPAVWEPRHPSGMEWFVEYAHSKGLKVGIYMPAGLEHGIEGTNPGQDLSTPIYGAPGCTLEDAIYPDHRIGNRFNSGYLFDFDNGTGCAQAYIDSIVALFESWGGVDLLKIDGFRNDNLEELKAYRKAFDATGHHVHIQLSWSIDRDLVNELAPYADSWRTGGDVECLFGPPDACHGLTNWGRIEDRFDSIIDWQGVDGPDQGWNNLDALIVGSAELDGLTETERQTTMSLWSIANAPLYLGDDLTRIDEFGLSLLTNRDVIAVNQDRLGASVELVARTDATYVFAKPLENGDVAVGLFNAGDVDATISTTVAATGAPATRGTHVLNDLWAGEEQLTDGSVSVSVPSHGSVMYRIATRPDSRYDCQRGGWREFTDPSFRNQGQCVSWVRRHEHGNGR